jgi:aryl-alcohol dehydrogenase-like predicted oxidoreductase
VEQRTLGKSALTVSAIGLGCMSMSNVYGKCDDAEATAVIHRALDLGVNFLDSSDMYGWGQNEELLGRALKGKRDRVVLATKFGNLRKPDGTAGVNGRPEYVPQACDASLKRLGVETIDLYFQHRVDPSVPIEETVGAMSRLVERGKVRYLGLSEASPATVRRAHSVHPITALQSEFSLLYRVEAEETLPVLRELGISFVAYSPLGRSLLTGSTRTATEIPADDRRRDHPRFQDENLQKNLDLLKPLLDMAKQKGCTAGQLALAWLLARGRDIVAIPGTKRKARLDENVAAAAVSITPAEVATLQDAVPTGAAAGTRYPGPAMKSVYI